MCVLFLSWTLSSISHDEFSLCVCVLWCHCHTINVPYIYLIVSRTCLFLSFYLSGNLHPLLLSRTQSLLTKIVKLCSEIRDIKKCNKLNDIVVNLFKINNVGEHTGTPPPQQDTGDEDGLCHGSNFFAPSFTTTKDSFCVFLISYLLSNSFLFSLFLSSRTIRFILLMRFPTEH